ncbi:VDE1 [Symbiodinium sp. CCMP2456]|nr:VDE1 [Symbiodinium sp. CCMP2456]
MRKVHRNGPLLCAVLLGIFAWRRSSQASGSDSEPRTDWALSLSSQEVEAPLPKAILVHPDRGTPSLAKGVVSTTWSEAAEQIRRRVTWDLDAKAELQVMTLTRFCQSLQRAPSNVSLVLGLDLSEKLPSPCTDQAKNNMLHSIPTRLFVNSSAPGFMESNSWYPSTKPKGRKAWKLLKRVLRLLHRQAEDELIQALLLLMNQHVIPLKAVEMQMPHPDPLSLARTGIFCGFHTAACMLQPQCFQGLFCIALCHLDDQTCAYRCLLKYDVPMIARFSECALEKQNVMNFHALPPTLPEVKPLDNYRFAQLTVPMANEILVGHRKNKEKRYSWIVAASSSAAYAQFRLQYQIWRYVKKRFLYHAVFLAEGRDGKDAWKTRTYLVKPLEEAGHWLFRASDSGIKVQEHWYLLGADRDLQWMVLYFAGVASHAGQAYRGSMLLTADGNLPSSYAMRDVEESLSRVGMALWELSPVDNGANHTAGPSPLERARKPKPKPKQRAAGPSAGPSEAS